MIGYVHNYDLLKACIEDILSTIKPVEDDRKKRLRAIQELADSIYSVGPLRGAAVKSFGSFISNLYAKSGDLDVSVDLWNGSRLPISKKKKQNALREVMKALQTRGVARYMEFIPTARVPILKYMSNHFGISYDVSINNYPGQIKSRILYWIGTMDERFGDMVLLVKEWAKAQNINDPKNRTLNSYSLCLLVIFHFQTCKPPILPPLKEIFDGKAAEELVLYDENHVDDICMANTERFLRQNTGHRNQSSLSFLLASFFHKFIMSSLPYILNSATTKPLSPKQVGDILNSACGINSWLMSEFFNIRSLSTKVISTYTGQFEQIQNNPSWMAKSYSLFVEDPFERPDNASRAVGAEELERIGQAFNYVSYRFTSGALADRDELLSLLCAPPVESILAAVRTNNTETPPSHQLYSPVAASLYDDQHHQRNISSSLDYAAGRQMAQPEYQYQSISRPQVYAAGLETAVPLQYHNNHTSQRTGRRAVAHLNQLRRWEYSPYQHSGTTRYDPAGRRWSPNGSTWDSASQASSSNTSWQR